MTEQCVATEQLFTELSEPVKFWVQDRLTEVDLLKAAELAEEYAMRRGQKRDPTSTDKPKTENRNGNAFSSKQSGARMGFSKGSEREGAFEKPKEIDGVAAGRNAN